ncbi:hypothetical protein NLI96_g12493 [Meripilus lineatus]|uniref:Uncharacterized protein n=1 Tax=Meripilus lineatus TaxID=2056292 RepID=A0AAD5UPX2_9APHY|nr:hypothetical protein NLI96_g12493 [Physisporinus lineatus]
MIAIRACNRYKDIWGEYAHEWKPERWISTLPTSITEARVPGVYSNIGFKFFQLEMKAVLSVLLGSFKFSFSDKEVVWNLAPAKYPTVGKTSMKPSMPLKVELL